MKTPLFAIAIRAATGLAALAEGSRRPVEKATFPENRPAREETVNRSDQIKVPTGTNEPQVFIVVEKPAPLDPQDAIRQEVILPGMPFITEPRLSWRERITSRFIIRSWYELWLSEECDSGVILVRLNF